MSREPTFDNAIAFAQDLIRIPSPSGKEKEVADRVREELDALGFEDVTVDRWGNVVGRIPGSGEAPSVMLNAHLDVVAEGDPDEWAFPPYGGVVEGGYLHGRGAMDIKGPLAVQAYAAAALGAGGFADRSGSDDSAGDEGFPGTGDSKAFRGPPPGDVVVAFTVHEERGGLGLHRLLDSAEEKPGAVILGEATQGDITIGHRGRAELEVVVHGVAGHASAPERARNSLDLVGPVLQGIRDLAKNQNSDPVLGSGSVVATMIDVLPETRNVIPDRAVVVVDWRVLPGETPDDTRERLERAVEGAVARIVGGVPEGFSIEVRVNEEHQSCYTGESETRALFAPGFLMDEDDPMVLAAARAAGRKGDPGTPARIRPWTFATDGGWSCGLLGIPTIGFAPGEEQHAHTNRERLSLEDARWALERYPEIIVAVQEALKEGG
ncbi:MAG: M20 family metallopeptidase [Longimicrobiales bacterium]